MIFRFKGDVMTLAMEGTAWSHLRAAVVELLVPE